MRRQSKPLIVLLVVVVSTFSFANRTLFQDVKATYVEGPITQDTTWNLVNSPFVVSKNVVVSTSATLFIEAGVEVRFGGNFSITVDGRLIANGTNAKPITFTSDRLTPDVGDWSTILLSGTQQSSLTYCKIEYGTSGITLESGGLVILNSFVRYNSGNGITILNGDFTAEYNEFAGNIGSGVYIAGCNRAIVENNNLTSNGDGIALTGDPTSQITIEHNRFSFNSHSGMTLEATAYDNTLILYNTFSANFYGFYVSSDVSTNITKNYLSNNTAGIFYDRGTNHQAHFNDIYDNGLGMDIIGVATVDATYNYWGDKSGPYHESLNPRGEGNPIRGDGINLDFIFFLSAPIGYSNQRPIATLWADKLRIARNQEVTFVGADSHDDGRVDQYFFDFGDGANSGWTTLSIFNHTYSSLGTYAASLTVVDDFNGTSQNIATTTITVQNIAALIVSTTISNEVVNFNQEVSVTVHVTNGATPIESATVTLFSVKGGSFAPLLGLTNSTGYFTTKFTAPDVTEISNIRIIARANATGYADGSDFRYLKVLPPLLVQITADPATIISETTSTITAEVTYTEMPIAGATVTISSSLGGSFSNTTEITDPNGNAEFIFTAPSITAREGANTLITVAANKNGLVGSEKQTTIAITPKLLIVRIAAQPNATISEEKANVTVQVAYSYDMRPITAANVTIESKDGGNFSTTTGLTDSDGNATFAFAAPQVNAPTDVIIFALAIKQGYADEQSQLVIVVNPGALVLEVNASSETVVSGQTAVINAYVACNATPIANASVTMSSNYGNFSTATGITDSEGQCTFLYNAPNTIAQLPVVLVANATKNGYVSAGNQTALTVTPETALQGGGGLPLTTILLIIIPIVVVVVVVALVKLKVLSFSFKGEEE